MGGSVLSVEGTVPGCGDRPEAEAKGRVLVVDDERGIRESLRLLLNDRYEVACADSVDGGIRFCEVGAPEMALVDIRMPGRDGFECLRELLRIDSATSVAMITAYASVEAVQEAMRMGAMGFVRKPIDVEEVRSLVASGIARCVRERKALRRAQQLEALSQDLSRALQSAQEEAELNRASAGLVHDLASPLTAVEFSVEALEAELADLRGRLGDAWPQLSEHLLTILENSRQCGSLLRVWRDLRKGLSGPLVAVRVSGVIKEVVRAVAGRCAGEGVEVVTQALGEELPVLGERTQIRRVFLNVMQNAIDAIGGVGGRVVIQYWTDLALARTVVVVEDDGAGVAPGIQDRIFEPYFTTKTQGGSSGLGLFVASQILRDFGASIELVADQSVGAAFRIEFPLAPEGFSGQAGEA